MSFEARFPGWCQDCGGQIKEGQQIKPADKPASGTDVGYVHAVCPPEPAQAAVCPACWTIHAGECL